MQNELNDYVCPEPTLFEAKKYQSVLLGLNNLDKPNRNKRVYTKACIEENINRLKDQIEQRMLVGELDPEENSSKIQLSNVSHMITKLTLEDDKLIAEVEPLNTPSGRVLNALLNAGYNVKLVPVGVGKLNIDENGIAHVIEYTMHSIGCICDSAR